MGKGHKEGVLREHTSGTGFCSEKLGKGSDDFLRHGILLGKARKKLGGLGSILFATFAAHLPQKCSESVQKARQFVYRFPEFANMQRGLLRGWLSGTESAFWPCL
jgi:hypothetical protein